MDSPTLLEILIPNTALNQLRNSSSASVGKVMIRAWDGPVVRLSRISDLERVNLVNILIRESRLSTSLSTLFTNGKETSGSKRSRKNSASHGHRKTSASQRASHSTS